MSDGDELSGVGRTSGARNEKTRQLMEEAVRTGRCPFCWPQFEENNSDRVIVLNQAPRLWNVFHNSGPLPGTSYHIMLAPRRHVTCSTQLEDDELSERQEIVEDLQDLFAYKSFTEFSRQGEMQFNSATVEHLHYHIVVSSGEAATESMVPPYYLAIIERIYSEISQDAEWIDLDPLGAMDKLREALDVWREAKRGKAVPIRAKLSNKVGLNRIT